MIYLTADQHFFHKNIIKFTGRPFSSIFEMNRSLIDNYNSVVSDDDTVLFLGDFAFTSILGQKEILSNLKGIKKIYAGNHDRRAEVLKDQIGFSEVYTTPQDWEYQGIKFRLSHYPAAPKESFEGMKFLDRRPSREGCDWLLCGHCFDEQTEILTKEGWKNKDTIKKDDLILSLNTQNNYLEYNKIENLIINQENTELLTYNNKRQAINFYATRKHHMFSKKRKTKEYKFWDLQDIKNVKNDVFYMRTSALMKKEGVPLTNNEIRILTWIVADGGLEYKKTEYPGLRFRLKKKRKIDRVSSLLSEMNIYFTYNKKSNRITVSIKEIKYLLDFFNREEKRIPQIFKDLNYEQSKVFLEEYGNTDGTIKKNKNSVVLYTSVREHAEIIQYICITNGHQCNILSRINKTGYSTDKEESYILNISIDKKESGVKTKDIKIEKYLGKTWCVSVPLGTVISRRNGKIVITGNCHEKWKTMENMINVGVDQWSFCPVSIDTIIEFIKNLKEKNYDPKQLNNQHSY